MIDIASIGVSTVIDQNYRRKAQLCLSGLFVTVSIATVTWFIFPASQNVLAPFLLPAMFLLFTLSMGYYMFIFSCEEKSLVKNVLGMVEPDESVKRVHCQENIKSLLAEVRSIAFLIIVRTGHRKAESTARRKDSNRGMFFLALFFIANQ